MLGPDPFDNATVRSIQAKLLAGLGRFEDAVPLAREAVEFSRRTDAINMQAAALMDLAEVLDMANDEKGAADAIGQALERYERKGNVVMAARARRRLDAARSSPRPFA